MRTGLVVITIMLGFAGLVLAGLPRAQVIEPLSLAGEGIQQRGNGQMRFAYTETNRPVLVACGIPERHLLFGQRVQGLLQRPNEGRAEGGSGTIYRVAPGSNRVTERL